MVISLLRLRSVTSPLNNHISLLRLRSVTSPLNVQKYVTERRRGMVIERSRSMVIERRRDMDTERSRSVHNLKLKNIFVTLNFFEAMKQAF